MADFFTDTYTDADNTAITSHTSDSGGTYTKHPTLATDSTAPKISSNTLVSGETSGTNAIYYVSAAPAGADYSNQIDITLAASSSVADGPAVRMSTSAGTAYFGLLFTAGTSVNLFKYVAGSGPTSIASVTVTLSASVVYRTKITASGSTISLRVQRLSDNQYLTSGGTWQASATDCCSVTDTDITAAGRPGFWKSQTSTSSTWDGMIANQAGGGSTVMAAAIYHRMANQTN